MRRFFSLLAQHRLPWVTLAVFLHAVFFVSLPTATVPPALPSLPPIQVSLVEPQKTENTAPTVVPPKPQVPKPKPKKPKSTPQPVAEKSPEPVAEETPETPEAVEETPQEVALPTPATPPSPPTAAPSNYVAARFDADYLDNPRPKYPAMSRKMREEGQVFLRVRVTPEGTAAQVEVKTGSGSERLDKAAVAAVQKWRFVPARQGNANVASWVVVPISFHLES
jgi:protein TonB